MSSSTIGWCPLIFSHLAPATAERIDVGKQAGSHPMPQAEINRLLVRLGCTGRTIVRLKGGDPFLFGRGGEEALELAAAGIRLRGDPRHHVGARVRREPQSAADPSQSRDRCSLHHRPLQGRSTAGDLDWAGLADPSTTLVVYMGLANIAEIAERLIAHGRGADTPVAAISKGTQDEQRQVVSTLDRIAADVSAASLPSPVLFIIGEVVDFALTLSDGAHGLADEIAVAAQ